MVTTPFQDLSVDGAGLAAETPRLLPPRQRLARAVLVEVLDQPYHGAFAPAASNRDRVVPVPPEDEGERAAFRSRQRRPCRAVGEKREKKPHWRRRWTWAELMRRSFGVDILICPHCETRRRLLTFITDPRTITRVLSHLGHPAELPPLSPARPPPEAPGLWEE